MYVPTRDAEALMTAVAPEPMMRLPSALIPLVHVRLLVTVRLPLPAVLPTSSTRLLMRELPTSVREPASWRRVPSPVMVAMLSVTFWRTSRKEEVAVRLMVPAMLEVRPAIREYVTLVPMVNVAGG